MLLIDQLTPKKIVAELDKYIIGQDKAKRAVAIALRNRWRRQNIEGPLQKEIIPNNIILIGPTGVGKTEIARRLSRLANAPFVKVEASNIHEGRLVVSNQFITGFYLPVERKFAPLSRPIRIETQPVKLNQP